MPGALQAGIWNIENERQGIAGNATACQTLDIKNHQGETMKCFYHQTTDSIGVCRSCGRGLCPDCVTEYPEGLACKNHCETAVQETIALVKRNRTAVARTAPYRYLFPAFFFAMGAIQLYQGVIARHDPVNAVSALGAIFIVVGIAYFSIIRRFYRG